jgi:hypothetical protein
MLFRVSNHQCKDSGPPPEIDGDRQEIQHGYYENEHGEQAVFEGNLETGEIVVRMGDCGWEKKLTLKPDPLRLDDEDGGGIVLNQGEKLWLRACWESMQFVRLRLQRKQEKSM